MAWVAYPGVLDASPPVRTFESAYNLCFGSLYLYDPTITVTSGAEQQNLYASAGTYDTYNDGCMGSRYVYPVAQAVQFALSAAPSPLATGATINDSYIEATYTETVEYLVHTEDGTFIACYADPLRTTFEADVVRNRGISCNLYPAQSNDYDIYTFDTGATQTGTGSTTQTAVTLANAAGTNSAQIIQGACSSVNGIVGHLVEVQSNWASYLTGPCGGGPPGTFTVRTSLTITDIKLWVDWTGGTPCPQSESGGGGNNVATIRTVTGGPTSGGNGQASIKRTISMTGSALGVSDAIIPIIENRYSPCDIRTQDLSSGDNTITWVTNAVGVVVIMPSSNSTVDVKIKGASGDTGVVINKTGILQFERKYTDASFILNASGALTGVRFLYY